MSTRKEGEFLMEETPEILPEGEDLGTGGQFKNWLQDNIRIILSVLIVIAIAAGIYSYSNRAEAPLDQEELAMEEILDGDNDGAVTIIGEEDEMDEEEDEMDEAVDSAEEVIVAADEAAEVQVGDDAKTDMTVSEETQDSFVQTAVAGDSVTTLSRKALRSFLEKNNDPSLSKEHKIYIEDYLRKNVGYHAGVNVGTKITFSKTLIRDAIEKSKTLNENQVENLKQYSARVTTI